MPAMRIFGTTAIGGDSTCSATVKFSNVDFRQSDIEGQRRMEREPIRSCE